MELRHLRYFVAVAEELHFARAAERLGIEQSPLSRQIKDLEIELGVTLFERTTRSTRLTRAGEVFLRDARAILVSVRTMALSAKEAAQGRHLPFRIGVADGVGTPRLSALLAGLRARLLDVEFRVLELPTAQQFEALRSGDLDFGVLLCDLGEDQQLASTVLWHEPLGVALSVEHPLVAHPSLDLDMLRGESIVMCHPDLGSGCYRQLMSVLRGAGIEPKITHYAFLRSTMLALVGAGLGLGLALLNGEGDAGGERVAIRPLRGNTGHLKVYGVSRSIVSGGPAATVLDVARSVA